MDSRIREIEQWLDEAKTDLQDGGREAYLRKLYLLDAEIRAVIKDNDPLPEIKQASTGRRPARKFSLPVAVAGFAALALISSAVVLNQVPLRSDVNPGNLTSDLSDASFDGSELTMADLNRFPQGEQLVSLEELAGANQPFEYFSLDRNRVFASLASETFSPDAAAGESPQDPSGIAGGPLLMANKPAPRKGLVGDIGDESVYGSRDTQPANQSTDVEVTMAFSRETPNTGSAMDMSSVMLPAGEPTHTSLSQIEDLSAQSETVTDSGNFYYFPGYGDSSGVDPKGSPSDANGRSSEVLLAGIKGDSKAKDSQAERKLDSAKLKKELEDKLRKKESKDS